jgi:hypothetical protein
MVAGALFAFGPYADIQARLGRPPLEETVGYGQRDVARQNLAFGPAERRAYGLFQILDLLQALVLALTLWIALTAACRALRPERPAPAWSAWPAMLVALAEASENLALLILTQQGSEPEARLAAFAGMASGSKFVCLAGAMLLAAGLWGTAAWRRWARRR